MNFSLVERKLLAAGTGSQVTGNSLLSKAQTGTGTNLAIMVSSEDKTASKCGGRSQSGMMSDVMPKDTSSVRKLCKTNLYFMN